MAKLYAEVNSDKPGRIASKGGDEYITLVITRNGKQYFTARIENDGIYATTYGDNAQCIDWQNKTQLK